RLFGDRPAHSGGSGSNRHGPTDRRRDRRGPESRASIIGLGGTKPRPKRLLRMSLRPGTTYPYHPAVRLNPKPPLRLARWFVLIVFLTGAATAQTKNDTGPSSFNPAVYRLGERLTYNVNYSQFVSAAHVEMVVAGRGIFFEREGVQLKAHVETSGVINVAL